MTASTFFDRINLTGVGFARLDEYFGLWAMEASRFRLAWERASQMDLKAHVEQAAPAKATIRTAAISMSSTPDTFGRQSQSIALVYASGVLMKQVPSGEHGTSTILLRRVIREAAADSSIAGVIFIIDSPGGTVSGTSDLAADIAQANESKPVWAYIEDLGASAAYWCACACERIVANHRTAAVGSIGTVLGLYDSSGWATKQGIEAVVIATGDLKGAGFPGAPISDEQRAYFQRLIDDTQSSFAQAVEQGRGLAPETVAELSTGGVWLADEAMQLGLIDAIQSLDTTIDEMRQHLSDAITGGAAAQQETTTMPRATPRTSKPVARTPDTLANGLPAKPAATPAARSKAGDDKPLRSQSPEDDDTKPKGDSQTDDEETPNDPAAEDTAGDDEECDCAGEDGCECDEDEPVEPASEDEEEDKPKANSGGAGKPSAKATSGSRAAEGQKFMKAFGAQGAVWYAEGKSFAQARKLHLAALEKENAELKAQLAGVDRGATNPIKLTGDDSKPKVSSKLAANVGGGVASFAAGIKLPGK